VGQNYPPLPAAGSFTHFPSETITVHIPMAFKSAAGGSWWRRRMARLGVRLGNPNGAAALRRAGRGGAPLREAIARNADRHAQDLAPVVADIRAGGATSLRAIAAELNARGMLTRRGGRWHVSTVMNLLERLGIRETACASPG
jgi:hypothetical protein